MPDTPPDSAIALLSGGWDRPYMFGLTQALAQSGMPVDLVAGDDLTAADFPADLPLRVLTLRTSHPPGAGTWRKAIGVLSYYARLLRYAWSAQPPIFHIVWNNGYELFDRTVLTLYYRLLGKTIALTAHNVNVGRRDGRDTMLNRLSLRFQYALCDHIFVHTEQMKGELVGGFGVKPEAVSVVPFGINNSVPTTAMTRREARGRLQLGEQERTLLFFGNIAPYKGLEYLIEAFRKVATNGSKYRLIVAGRPKPGFAAYWTKMNKLIGDDPRILCKSEFIPDADTEIYFKAADALVLPYTTVFQSGVLFLGYSFGLPTLAANVGSLKDDVIEGENGFMFAPQDADDLARTIEKYFASELFKTLHDRRCGIREQAEMVHSWDTVARLTRHAYARVLALETLGSSLN